MCSGCSGPYEGDCDDQNAGPDFCGGAGEMHEGPWPSAEREAKWPRSSDPGRNGCYESRSGAQESKSGEEEDDYQVWVSAERIIERRTIRANCCFCKQSGAVVEMEIWPESGLARKHSEDLSAKCYQTQRKSRREPRAGSGIGPTRLVIWVLAGAMGFALALWLALR